MAALVPFVTAGQLDEILSVPTTPEMLFELVDTLPAV